MLSRMRSLVRYDYKGGGLCSLTQGHGWFGKLFTASEYIMNVDARLR